MTLEKLLMLRECKNGTPEKKFYLDSLKKPTVGIGHLVTPIDKLKVGDEVDDDRIQKFFKKDSAKAVSAANSQASEAGIKDSEFKVYLASVNFQLGTNWTSKFKNSWKLIVDGKYEEAAKRLEKSAWYQQTPTRVKDFQKALRDLAPKTDGKKKGGAPVA